MRSRRSLFSRIAYRLRTFVTRDRAERDLRREIDFHLQMEAEKYIAEGMAPDAARLRARKAFGGLEQHKETLRDGFGFPRLEQLLFDARIAYRGLRQSPLFAVAVTVTLALGLGASSTIFSAVHEVLLRPLPYPDAERLVTVYARHQQRGLTGINVSYPDYLSWRQRNSTFESMAVYQWWSGTFGSGLGAERVAGALISSDALDVLRVRPMLGRGFGADDATRGAESVVLLGHGLWQRRYGSDPAIIGQLVRVDGEPRTVTGVMPPSFRFPSGEEAWLPMVPGEDHEMRAARFLSGAIGRLADGVTATAAQADLEAISQALKEEFQASNEGWDAHLIGLRDDLVGPIGPGLMVLQGAVLILLMIICVNVGGLILARTVARSPEFAVRRALGAQRGRILAQIGTESLVLGCFAALASLVVLFLGQSRLRNLLVEDMGLVQNFELRGPTWLFLVALILASTVLFGIIPALGLARRPLEVSLAGGGRSISASLPASSRSAFVAGQLAMVTVLLVASALLVRTVHSMERIDPGFRPDVLTARIGLTENDFPTAVTRDNVVTTILERLRALPGVEAAGAVQGAPFSGWNVHRSYQVIGEPTAEQGQELNAHVQAVRPGFFETLGVSLVRGRSLLQDDDLSVLINESFRRRHFEQSGALGNQVLLGEDTYTIAGVVADYRHFDLLEEMMPAIYLPWKVVSPSALTLVLRTDGDPSRSIPDLRRVLAEVVPNSPPYRVSTLAEAVRRQGNNSRVVRDLLTGFAALSVLLAILGLYATIAYSVDQRRRELGLRFALGATPSSLTVDVLRKSLGMVCGGIALGVAVGLFLTRFLRGLLFEVTPGDPWTFATIALGVFALAVIATWVPAREATRRDPVSALRSE